MEAVLMSMNSTGNNNRIRNPKRNFGTTNRTLFPYPSDDLSYLVRGGHFTGIGLSPSIFRPPVNLHHFHQPPPLLPLPLPVSVPLKPQNLNIARSNSASVSNNNIRVKKSSKNPKKPKNKKQDLKKPESSNIKTIEPDVKDVSKDEDGHVVTRVFSSTINNKSCDDVLSFDEFSGSVMFTPSPPPSSLPLPTFSLRSKVSCKAEASAVAPSVDAGATDSLRRLLRL